jgi:hypothetical protein
MYVGTMVRQYIATSVPQYVTSYEYTSKWRAIIRDCLVMLTLESSMYEPSI